MFTWVAMGLRLIMLNEFIGMFLGIGNGVKKLRVKRMLVVYGPVAVEYLLPVYVYCQVG
jgi:hypothetical protein